MATALRILPIKRTSSSSSSSSSLRLDIRGHLRDEVNKAVKEVQDLAERKRTLEAKMPRTEALQARTLELDVAQYRLFPSDRCSLFLDNLVIIALERI